MGIGIVKSLSQRANRRTIPKMLDGERRFPQLYFVLLCEEQIEQAPDGASGIGECKDSSRKSPQIPTGRRIEHHSPQSQLQRHSRAFVPVQNRDQRWPLRTHASKLFSKPSFDPGSHATSFTPARRRSRLN
jgi:hypothetical protein